MTIKLNDKALLVQLNVSQWTARKYDRKITAEIANQHGASMEAGRYNKRLLDSVELEEVHKLTGMIRKEYYANTLPWGMEGSQILPTTNYFAFVKRFGDLKSEWERKVRAFLEAYPQLREDAKRLLPNGMYNEEDYPSEDALASRFRIEVNMMPLPATDFRLSLNDDEIARIQEDVKARLQHAQQTAMRELWGRLYERVKHIAERLSDPDALFRNSMIENARDICDMLPRLNVMDDPMLAKMGEEVRRTLLVDPDGLREDKVHRADKARQAQAIIDQMGAFMGIGGV